MTMPIDLVLIRHGESEGNAARRCSAAGDNAVFTEEFCRRHNSRFRLTDRGREQARLAGTWLKENFRDRFDRYLVSGYLRAMETAGLLDLPDAAWYQEFYLRERDMGLFEIMSEDDKKRKHPEVYRQYEFDPFYWTPPNGESIAQLCLRIDRVLHTLHRECSDKRVIVVAHGLVMWAFMLRIERLTPGQYLEKSQSSDRNEQIRNCQIIHYTRLDPTTNLLSTRVDWVRSVCPWEIANPVPMWRKIERPKFTNGQLMEAAEAAPRIMVSQTKV
jgi:NAD+ kinase